MSNAACRLKKMNPKKIAFGCVNVEVNGDLGRKQFYRNSKRKKPD